MGRGGGGVQDCLFAWQVFEEFGYKGKLNSPEWLAQPAFLQTFEEAGAKQLAALSDLPVVQLLSDKNVRALSPPPPSSPCAPVCSRAFQHYLSVPHAS